MQTPYRKAFPGSEPRTFLRWRLSAYQTKHIRKLHKNKGKPGKQYQGIKKVHGSVNHLPVGRDNTQSPLECRCWWMWRDRRLNLYQLIIKGQQEVSLWMLIISVDRELSLLPHFNRFGWMDHWIRYYDLLYSVMIDLSVSIVHMAFSGTATSSHLVNFHKSFICIQLGDIMKPQGHW